MKKGLILSPILICLLSILLGAVEAQAAYDQLYGVGARTIPLGAGGYADAGYGLLLWGEKEKREDFMYGYVRPAATFSGSGLTGREDLHLEVFPISFFGLSAGTFFGFRTIDSGNYDCRQVACQGILHGSYLRGKLTLGYGSFFATDTYTYSDFKPENKTQPFLDEQSALAGSAGEDHLEKHDWVIGYKIDASKAAGLQMVMQKMQGTQAASHYFGAFGALEEGRRTLIVGGGYYDSSVYQPSPVVFAAAQWTIRPSIGLH